MRSLIDIVDFTPAELDKAILAYQKRDRRFGGVKEDSKNG